MNKEIIVIDEKKKIYRITTLDERWYGKLIKNKVKGLPEYKYFPSSTWIAGYYPKGIAFHKWLANHGWDEAEAIKVAAGDKGSKVHYACQEIDTGKGVDIQHAKYPNKHTDELEGLKPEDIECILAYRDWVDETKPELLANEITVFGPDYAGTIDKIFRIDGEIWIVDLKTGQNIWEEQILQISSYSNADIDYKKLGITDKEWKERKLATLQIGYRRNKRGYKFTEQPDKYEMFRVAYQIWANENPDASPKQRDYPLVIQSEFRKEQKVKTNV